MMRWLAAAVLAVGLGLAAWFGWRAWHPAAPAPAAVQAVPVPGAAVATDIETVASGENALPTGGTPMGQRIAVIGLLNKRNGVSREVTLKPGQATRLGDVVIRLDACERTAPWEQETLTGAFVQLTVRGVDGRWRRAFSGWLFKERPALNVVEHPVYDVWTKSCTMSWPETGPDTTVLPSPRKPSSAPNRPGGSGEVDEPIAPSNARVNDAI
jgi:hypothetical protein